MSDNKAEIKATEKKADRDICVYAWTCARQQIITKYIIYEAPNEIIYSN